MKADSLADLSDRDLDYVLRDAARGSDSWLQFETGSEIKQRRDHIPTHVRQAVWARDGGKCTNCGATDDLQYDHIIPDSKGGGASVENIELLCGTCNRQKAARIE